MKYVNSVIIAVSGLLWGALVTFFLLYGRQTDFTAYYNASVRFASGDSPYRGVVGLDTFLYPPLLLQGLLPFTANLSAEAVAVAWHIASLVSMLIALALISYELRHTKLIRVVWIMALLFTPFIQSFIVGQVTMLMFLGIVAGWAFARQGCGMLAGFALAIVTWIKLYPVFLLAYFVWRRQWSVVISGLITGFTLLFIQLFAGNLLITYVRDILPLLALEGQDNAGLFKNSSILGFSRRLYIDTIDNVPLLEIPSLVTPTRLTVLLIIFGVLIYFLSQPFEANIQSEQTKQQFDYEYALVLIAALLFGSTLWISGAATLLLAYVILFIYNPPRVTTFLGWLSFAMLSFYLLMIMSRPIGADWSWAILSLGFFAIMLLWLLLVIMRWRISD